MPTDRGWIALGTAAFAREVEVPFPDVGKGTITKERAFDGERNSNHVLRGHFVGRSIIKINWAISRISAEKWTEIDSFIERCNNYFYITFLSPFTLKEESLTFYSGNPTVDTNRVQFDGSPNGYFYNVSRNFIDWGE